MFISGQSMAMLAGQSSSVLRNFLKIHVYFGILIGFGRSILIITGLSIKLILVRRAGRSATKYLYNTKEGKSLPHIGMVNFK